MISGYCRCGYPASTKCSKCGIKICGNCAPDHICDEKPSPEPEQIVFRETEPQFMQQEKRKPGRPPIRK